MSASAEPAYDSRALWSRAVHSIRLGVAAGVMSLEDLEARMRKSGQKPGEAAAPPPGATPAQPPGFQPQAQQPQQQQQANKPLDQTLQSPGLGAATPANTPVSPAPLGEAVATPPRGPSRLERAFLPVLFPPFALFFTVIPLLGTLQVAVCWLSLG